MMSPSPLEKPVPISQALQQAVLFHRQGQFAEAERLYGGVLQAKPDHFDALHLLGVLMHQRGRSEEALALIAKALATGAKSADAYSNHGRVLCALGRTEEALGSFGHALVLKPDHLEALIHRGNVLLNFGRLNEALTSYDQALALKPDHSHALVNRGVALQRSGRSEEAAASFDLALAVNPANVEALVNRGNALLSLKQADDALASYDKAIALRPDNSEALFNRGNALAELQRPADALSAYDLAHLLGLRCFDLFFNRGNALMKLQRRKEALSSYDEALALNADHIELLVNRGNSLCELNRPMEALASFDRALALAPAQPEALNNRGNALLQLCRPAEALECYDRALAIDPNYNKALINRGNALADLGCPQEAISCYEKAIAAEPDNAEAHWNKSLILLAQGDFEQGWREYQWRLRRAAADKRDFPQPLWSGSEAVTGKTILLHSEQGFGDTLQFVRYVPIVAARGARVLLQVQTGLKPLLQSIAGAAAVVGRDETLPAFDLHCPLLSLPMAVKTVLNTIPGDVPYIHAPAERVHKWQKRMGDMSALRVGIAWAGSATHKNDRNRSIALQRLGPLLAMSAVGWVSLQKDVGNDDLHTLERWPQVAPLGCEFEDFADAAAVISLLDIVISVDTAVAHLAGAMGKKTYILLPFHSEWRWLSGRDDSPWYPTVRLFRQPSAGEWDKAIANVRRALESEL